MAAAEQRAKVLNWRSCLAAPFGAPVHLRKKAFDKAGPLRREHGLESKWLVGKYVGLSTIVHRGHLVYVEAMGDEKEKFLRTLHVRPNLVDPGGPSDELVEEFAPKPRRRILEKTGPENVEMKAMSKTPDELRQYVAAKSTELLASWSLERAIQLISYLADMDFFGSQKFGVYRHGGTVGWLTGLVEFPELSKVMVKIVIEIEPGASFTSIMVSHNSLRTMHKDFNNDHDPELRDPRYNVQTMGESYGWSLSRGTR